jgi:hypothetical protein
MRRSFLHGLPAWMLVAVVSIALAGCWNPFAPPPGDDPPETKVQYKVRTSPENVIYNLGSAYKDTNLDEYLACLADNFEFILNPDDVNNPDNDLPESWGKTEEENIHARMFGEGDTTGVDNIDLTLTYQNSQWYQGEDPVDPSDDTWEFLEGTDLRVTIGEWTFLANADQRFTFQIDPNEVGQNGEDLWEIVVWRDEQEQPYRHDQLGDNTELSSVGRIKAMYR